MKITVMSVGKVRQKFVLDGELEYLRRFSSGIKVELLELGMDSPESLSVDETRHREADEITKRLAGFDYTIVLDEKGKRVTSEGFKVILDGRMNAGTKRLCFLIGGAYGVSEKVRQGANYVLSLSELTFPHQLTRLLLIEQIYRAQTMMRGIRYHK